MKIAEALRIMAGSEQKRYRVHLEWIRGGILVGDFFPELGEPPIETEDEAWKMAEKFASNTKGLAVNIYVIDADNFTPVDRYRSRMIKNR